VPLSRPKAAEVPRIFDFSAEKAKIADWLAERGGFETHETLLRIDGRNLARVWPTIQPDSKPSVLKKRTFFTKEFESSSYLSGFARHPECAEIQRTRTSHGCSSNPPGGQSTAALTNRIHPGVDAQISAMRHLRNGFRRLSWRRYLHP
jgi:hypothetical protein